jgi:hypothetical protein
MVIHDKGGEVSHKDNMWYDKGGDKGESRLCKEKLLIYEIEFA